MNLSLKAELLLLSCGLKDSFSCLPVTHSVVEHVFRDRFRDQLGFSRSHQSLLKIRMSRPFVPIPLADIDVEIGETGFLLFYKMPVRVSLYDMDFECQEHGREAEAESKTHGKKSSHNSRFPAEVDVIQMDQSR